MKIEHAAKLVGLSLCLAGSVVQLGGCASVPKPAEADGSARVPANDPARVQAFQQQVTQDREMLTENNLLKAQVATLQQKLNELSTVLREAVLLPQVAPRPPAPPVAAPNAKPVAPASTLPAAAPSQQQSKLVSPLPAYAYRTTQFGVLIRVNHPFARTEFEPSEAAAQALRVKVRGAEAIEVRGYTDSNVVNPIDRLIAIERAQKARTWLINNGAEPAVITTKSFTAGRFMADNRTQQGRSLNRRVEIDIRNPKLNANPVAM
ncbi:hypothetical protein EIP75_21615 [Aquabacterium soli]|uniref:OmpA-like domain-containing protein n=1 Tax=Aquabacterium soli TaxID=2493092 RepID=A0A3R8SYX2_9BURK|nr:OmpA family protein [Aquabacterium soli]RRS01176.1 hypothetical protein EIP75_21615 [Aquabacterium soli]